MSKRANGEGSFYFDEAKGLYRAMLTTPNGKRLTKSSKDEDIVKDWLNEQRLLIGRSQHVEPHSMTLKEWLDEWLEVYSKPSVRPRTYDRNKSLLAHADSIGNIKLQNLTPSHIQRMYNSLSAYSGQTRRHIHNCLHNALQQAVTNLLIHSNPTAGVKPPTVVKKEIEVFTKAEVKKLFEAGASYRFPVILNIAYNTGMRLSEILALRWQDVDTKKGTVSINQTVHRSDSAGVQFEEPKTASSKRKITIPPDTIQALIAHKLKTGVQNGLLFVTMNNTPMHSGLYLKKIYNPIREKADVTEKGFHAFRHTHASMLLSAGVPIQDVSKRLGHAKVSTTLDIYSHCMPLADEKILRTIKRINIKQNGPV